MNKRESELGDASGTYGWEQCREGSVRRKENLEDTGVGGRKIVKCMLEKYDWMVWIGLTWIKTGTRFRCFWRRNWNFGFLRMNRIHISCTVHVCVSLCFVRHAMYFRNVVITYRVIHKALGDFRPLRCSSQVGHAEGEHVNRGRDTPSFCPTLQVLDMSTLGDAADVNPVIKFLPHTLHVCGRNTHNSEDLQTPPVHTQSLFNFTVIHSWYCSKRSVICEFLGI